MGIGLTAIHNCTCPLISPNVGCVPLLGCTCHVSEEEFEHPSWDEQRAENRAGKFLTQVHRRVLGQTVARSP